MVVRVGMVVMDEKQKGDGGEDGSLVVVVIEFVEGGEIVTGIVAGMVVGVVAGDVVGEEGFNP